MESEIDLGSHRFLVMRLCDLQIIGMTDTLESARNINIVSTIKGEDCRVAIYEAREPRALKRFRLVNIEITYDPT